MVDAPILSICIPTYNRAVELARCIEILAQEFSRLSEKRKRLIEIIVSDNYSTAYQAETLFSSDLGKKLPIKLYIQEENIGATNNFEFCYNIARGRFILILSDDDHFTAGSLALITKIIESENPDIVFLPFHPISSRRGEYSLMKRDVFFSRVGVEATLISSCILRRDLIVDVLGQYLDTQMHHFHYFLQAMERGETFVFVNRRVLHCPYQENSGGYDWFKVFGFDYFRIIDEFPAVRIGKESLLGVRLKMFRDRVIPRLLNYRIDGFVINARFAQNRSAEVFETTHHTCKDFRLYWALFWVVANAPKFMLHSMRKLYQFQKEIGFRWH